MKCVNCKSIHYNYRIFHCLISPLEEVKNYLQNNNNNKFSIYECFYYNQKSEHLNGDNQWYCNISNNYMILFTYLKYL